MKTIHTHSRKDQIVINLPTNEFAKEYFKIIDPMLQKSYIFKREINGNKINFSGSIFRFVWNGWNVFNTISKGEIEFFDENNKPYIAHKIYFTEVLIIAAIFNIIPLFTLKYDPWLSLFVFLAIWIFYTANYLITVFRFNSYVTEVLIKANIETDEFKESEEETAK